jgi:hypothetical protein
MSDMSDVNEDESEGGIDRRAWLGGAAVAGIGVVGGAIAGAGVAAAQNSDGVARRKSLIIDIACDGTTFRSQRYPTETDDYSLDSFDQRGTPLSVEGWMYPAGTVSDGFIITEEGSIGRWFCAGFIIRSSERDEPHINAQANFVFGTLGGEFVFPEDTLMTSGLGGTSLDEKSNLAVLGGTGTHLGASGQASRWNVGTNNTNLHPGTTASPNFTYEFDLLYAI